MFRRLNRGGGFIEVWGVTTVLTVHPYGVAWTSINNPFVIGEAKPLRRSRFLDIQELWANRRTTKRPAFVEIERDRAVIRHCRGICAPFFRAVAREAQTMPSKSAVAYTSTNTL